MFVTKKNWFNFLEKRFHSYLISLLLLFVVLILNFIDLNLFFFFCFELRFSLALMFGM